MALVLELNRDNTEPVAGWLATIAAMDAAQESYVPGQVTIESVQ